ncbi:hypothetical protein OH77DRAFT_621810 [Trametes cingulata]|nr:hypothetical protein OH77DRAFT_621810 [Trametes cingulata]
MIPTGPCCVSGCASSASMFMRGRQTLAEGPGKDILTRHGVCHTPLSPASPYSPRSSYLCVSHPPALQFIAPCPTTTTPTSMSTSMCRLCRKSSTTANSRTGTIASTSRAEIQVSQRHRTVRIPHTRCGRISRRPYGSSMAHGVCDALLTPSPRTFSTASAILATIFPPQYPCSRPLLRASSPFRTSRSRPSLTRRKVNQRRTCSHSTR